MEWGKIWRVFKASGLGYVNKSISKLGASLAYYTVFAISPIMVIVIFVAGLFFDRADARRALFQQMTEFMGPKGANTLEAALNAVAPSNGGILATSIAVAMLLVTGTGLFLELQSSLNIIFGVEPAPGRGVAGFIKNRLLSLSIVVGTGCLLLLSLVVSATLSALSKYTAILGPDSGTVWKAVDLAVSMGLMTLLFGMIYKVLPDARIAWRDVGTSALLIALLFTLGKALLASYLGRNSAVSAYGAAGSLVLVLLWVYYSAQLLFFGAEFARNYAEIIGKRLEPKKHARWSSPSCEARPASDESPRGAEPGPATT